MNILFLVHIEESFRSLFPAEWSEIESYANVLEGRLEDIKWDRIIHMTSYIEDLAPIPEVEWLAHEDIEFSWGYEPCMLENQPGEEEWLIESSGHEWTWVPPELRDFEQNGDKIFVGGGHDAECLEDFRCVLQHIGVEFEDARELIYPQGRVK